jgi:hypothetical protein
MKNTEKKPVGQHYAVKSPSRGGARPGAGRKKGSTPRYTVESLLENLELQLGRSYSEQIAVNYVNAIGRSDWGGVRDYDRILLGKTLADKMEIETTEGADAVQARAEAFAEALTALAGKGK